MVVISEKTLSWLPTVKTELSRVKNPLPYELILSVIDVESGGTAGLTNQKSGASGLMQVMPFIVDDFNQAHGTHYTLDDMRSPSQGAKQIRVGVWILGRFWRRAYKYLKKRMPDVPINQLMLIADTFYVAGPGATMKRLDKLTKPTFENLETSFPNWNALPHPRRVRDRVSSTGALFNLDAIEQWLNGEIAGQITTKGGLAMALIILGVAYWHLGKDSKNV